jgi:hypothetical protein
VEHGVVEVCVGVGARSSAQQALTALAAQEGHVLHQMCHTLQAQEKWEEEEHLHVFETFLHMRF